MELAGNLLKLKMYFIFVFLKINFQDWSNKFVKFFALVLFL